MKNLAKRGLSLLLVLVLCLSLLPAIQTPAEAAVQNVTYVTSGTTIKNWGERGETATFLSQNAAAFYTDNSISYAELAALPGSSNVANVPSSSLYSALHTLMYDNLDNPTSYDGTKNLYQYTDCENSGNVISSFYSGKSIGPAWGSTPSWNREHTWPNSKSTSGSDSSTARETDIMMLRPTASSENGSRSNTAYGASSGYYHPNSESDTDGAYNTISAGEHDLRGDVARVVLYVYTCWGTSTQADGCLDYMWGTSGVIESKDVLLDWMEADPVDTWELGRNDSVESITGTRNVFVDYPELAFALFEEEVPTDYTTPSGIGDGSTGGSYTLTFKQAGATKGTSASSAALPEHFGAVPDGFTFEGWVTATVSETTTKPVIYKAGTNFIATADTTLHALYSQSTAGGAASYVKVTSAPSDWSGTYLIVYETGKIALKGSASTLDVDNNYVGVTISNNSIAATSTMDANSFTIEKSGSSYTIKTANGTYIGNTGSNNKLMNSTSTKYTNTITMSGSTTVVKGSGGTSLQAYKSGTNYRFRYYKSSQQAIALYQKQATMLTTYTTASCTHPTTISKDAVPASCGEVGYTAGTWCTKCESYVTGGDVIPALGHAYNAVVTPPTTTDRGYTTHTCTNGCGTSYVDTYVDALSYTVSFSVPAGVTKPADVHCNSTTFNLPTPVGTPLGAHTYTFVGWAAQAVNNTTSVPTLVNSKYSATGSVTLHAVYRYTVGGSGDSTYRLVTNASQLAAGYSVIITAASGNIAMGNKSSNGNNRTAVKDIVKGSNALSNTGNAVEFTLGTGKVADTFSFYDPTAKGYLYAASSSSNYLKTKSDLDNNGSFAITVTSAGVATVKAQGSYTRNWMRYNSSSSLFACYGSGQADISLYVRTGTPGTAYYTSDIDLGATVDDTLKFKGVNLTLKDSQHLNFNALQSVVDQYEDVYAVLEADGKQIAVVTDPFTHTDANGNVRYNYSFRDLNILDFGLEVKATLYGTKDGKLYCSPTVSYTLLQYCNTAIDNGTADAVPCAYLLKYVQAAEAYKNVAADDRISASTKLEATLDSALEAKAPATNATLDNGEVITFTAQALDMGNRVAMLYKMDFSKFTGDTADVTFTVSYTDIEGAAATKNYSFADLTATGTAGIYQLSFAELYATQMSEELTCSIYVDGDLEATYQNSIEHYCAKAQGSDEGDLALRIFLFGEAAKAAYAS